MLGTDGLFDKISSQDCIDFVRNEMARSTQQVNSLNRIAQQLVNIAILVRRVKDNVTVMLVSFNRQIGGYEVGVAGDAAQSCVKNLSV